MRTVFLFAFMLLMPVAAHGQEVTLRPLFGLPAREARSEFFGLGQYSRSSNVSRSVVYEQAKPVVMVPEATTDETLTVLEQASSSVTNAKAFSFSRTTAASRSNMVCVDGQCDVKTVAPLRLVPRRRR